MIIGRTLCRRDPPVRIVRFHQPIRIRTKQRIADHKANRRGGRAENDVVRGIETTNSRKVAEVRSCVRVCIYAAASGSHECSGRSCGLDAWRACCLDNPGRTPAMKVAVGICGFLALIALPVDGDDRLKMRVSPAQSFAPSILRVQVRIEPNGENRALYVVADSSEFYRSSEIPLEGDRAPATIHLEFRGVPAGEYAVVGVLKDQFGHDRSIARSQATVMPSGIGR
jgi:hypothetical protein